MSTEGPLSHESPYWRIEEEECEGLAVKARIIPDETHATELVHAAQARKLTMDILRMLGFNQTERLSDIALVLGEFVANCIKYGGEINEVDIDYDPETLRIQTLNPVLHDTTLVDSAHRGERATDVPNDQAEGGRGLQLTEALASEWGQMVIGRFVLTYASFYNMKRQTDTVDVTLPKEN